MPSHVAAMAPRAEVQRVFPQADGVTRRTVYVTPEQIVTLEQGDALRVNVVQPPASAPGQHLGDGRGNVMEWVGYEPVSLTIKEIETPQHKLSYNSLTGKARRVQKRTPDRDVRAFLGYLESDTVDLGDRTYAGLRCRAKHIPMLGAQSEACVVDINGWPVALYLQMPGAELNWYRATRITRGVCASAADVALPVGVRVEERAEPPVAPAARH